jgi:hypothetical protein
MSRYKGRASAKAIERDFPYIVEMQVPLGSFGKKLYTMYDWFARHSIKPLTSTGRRDEHSRDYIRWCFADAERANAFAAEFNAWADQ